MAEHLLKIKADTSQYPPHHTPAKGVNFNISTRTGDLACQVRSGLLLLRYPNTIPRRRSAVKCLFFNGFIDGLQSVNYPRHKGSRKSVHIRKAKAVNINGCIDIFK